MESMIYDNANDACCWQRDATTAIFHFRDGLPPALRSMTLAAVAAVADDNDDDGKDMSVGDEKQKTKFMTQSERERERGREGCSAAMTSVQ